MTRILLAARAGSRFIAALVAVVLVGAPSARANQEWGDQIPNLPTAGGCDGLCHATGLLTSPLYIDLEAAGFVWNATMANADSDGDGFSNGWELQDPSGTWVSGTTDPGNAAFVSNPAFANLLPPLPVATNPTAITHAEAAGQNGSEGFALQNVGGVPFDYSITSSDIWMAPDPPSALGLPASDQDAILVLFATNGLVDGLYQGDLTISIPGIRADRIPTIPVSLTVPEPGAVAAATGALLGLGMLGRRRVMRR